MACSSCSGNGRCRYCNGTGYVGGIARAGQCRACSIPGQCSGCRGTGR